ncbi:creatininase family protein [Qaidamihabitans albus]|uniref:creatininase family protein n=1 Tax=Qaidamihabitans albus TaxID=2795733 RepID=UPI0018F13B1B|nr:creatininase family protein [Qaidamihabitans albus]
MITTASSHDVRDQGSDIAVLPIGSFEQHGDHLPLATDTLIACSIARRIANVYSLFLLPPITISCSHEHADFAGPVSISATTVHRVIGDIQESLNRSSVAKLVLINAHGGNYVLSNVVQESNAHGQRMVLYPSSTEWEQARRTAGLTTNVHEDMHAGEAETSILLAEQPDLVAPSYGEADWTADDRRHLLSEGVMAYSKSGVIGRPSLATADKGKRLLDAFAAQFKPYLGLV